MDEFETVADPTGFSWKRKLVPSDADGLTRKRINGYNRLAKKRARDRHAQPAQQQQSVGGRGRRADSRTDVQFEERSTPSKSSGSVYMHELSPNEQLSPASRTRLQTRRRRRAFDARKASKREVLHEEIRVLQKECETAARTLDQQIAKEHEEMDHFFGLFPRLEQDTAVMAT